MCLFPSTEAVMSVQAPWKMLKPSCISDGQFELVKAVCSIYSTSSDSDDLVSDKYVEDCSFSDPLVEVFGQVNTKAQFRSLRMLFSEIDFKVHGVGLVGEGIVIHATVSYFPRALPRACVIRLEQFTKLMTRDGLILSHEDHWSIHGTMRVVSGLGWIYGWWRQLFGKASSMGIDALSCPKRKTS